METAETTAKAQDETPDVYDEILDISNDESEESENVAEDESEGRETEAPKDETKPENELLKLEGEDKDAKVAELLEADELSDEEAEFLTANGHEVEFESESATSDKSDEEKEEKQEEEKEEEEKPEEEPENVRPQYADFVEGLYPDQEFKSREDYEKAAMEHFRNEQEANEKLVAVIEDNPELGALIKDLTSGKKTFIEALHANVDLESLEVKPGDEDYEKVVRAKIERERAKEEQKKAQAQLQENIKKSSGIAIDFAKEKGLQKSESDQLFSKIDSMINDFNQGIVSKEFLEAMHKGLNYDRLLKEKEEEVRKAEQRGEVKGKNAAILVKKKKSKGDGVAHLNSSKKTIGNSSKKYDDPVTELLDRTLLG